MQAPVAHPDDDAPTLPSVIRASVQTALAHPVTGTSFVFQLLTLWYTPGRIHLYGRLGAGGGQKVAIHVPFTASVILVPPKGSPSRHDESAAQEWAQDITRRFLDRQKSKLAPLFVGGPRLTEKAGRDLEEAPPVMSRSKSSSFGGGGVSWAVSASAVGGGLSRDLPPPLSSGLRRAQTEPTRGLVSKKRSRRRGGGSGRAKQKQRYNNMEEDPDSPMPRRMCTCKKETLWGLRARAAEVRWPGEILDIFLGRAATDFIDTPAHALVRVAVPHWDRDVRPFVQSVLSVHRNGTVADADIPPELQFMNKFGVKVLDALRVEVDPSSSPVEVSDNGRRIDVSLLSAEAICVEPTESPDIGPPLADLVQYVSIDIEATGKPGSDATGLTWWHKDYILTSISIVVPPRSDTSAGDASMPQSVLMYLPDDGSIASERPGVAPTCAPVKNCNVYVYRSQEDMLREFLQIVQALQPDAIVGHNVAGYDLPALGYACLIRFPELAPFWNAALSRLVPPALVRKQIKTDALGVVQYYALEAPGLLVFDTLMLARMFFAGDLRGLGYSLAALGNVIVHKKKLDMPYIAQVEAWESGSPQRRAFLAKYNSRDSEIPLLVMVVKQLFLDVTVTANTAATTPEKVMTGGQVTRGVSAIANQFVKVAKAGSVLLCTPVQRQRWMPRKKITDDAPDASDTPGAGAGADVDADARGQQSLDAWVVSSSPRVSLNHFATSRSMFFGNEGDDMSEAWLGDDEATQSPRLRRRVAPAPAMEIEPADIFGEKEEEQHTGGISAPVDSEKKVDDKEMKKLGEGMMMLLMEEDEEEEEVAPTTTPGQSVIRRAGGFKNAHTVFLESVQPKPGSKYVGADVSWPGGGIVSIATIDFASLYPSNFGESNQSKDTLTTTLTDVHPDDGVYTQMLPDGSVVHFVQESRIDGSPSNKSGYFMVTSKSFLSRRSVQKKLMAEATDPEAKALANQRQKALKTMANAMYGFTGAEMSSLAVVEMAITTVMMGRERKFRLEQAVAEAVQNIVLTECVWNADTTRVRVHSGGSGAVVGLVTVRELIEAVTTDVAEDPGYTVACFDDPVVLTLNTPQYVYHRPPVYVCDIEEVTTQRAAILATETTVPFLPPPAAADNGGREGIKWTRDLTRFPLGTPRAVQLASERLHLTLHVSERVVCIGARVYASGVVRLILQDPFAAEAGLTCWPVMRVPKTPPPWVEEIEALPDFPPPPSSSTNDPAAFKEWEAACIATTTADMAMYVKRPVGEPATIRCASRPDKLRAVVSPRGDVEYGRTVLPSVQYGDTDSIMSPFAMEALPKGDVASLRTRRAQCAWINVVVRAMTALAGGVSNGCFNAPHVAEPEDFKFGPFISKKRYFNLKCEIEMNKATGQPRIALLYMRGAEAPGGRPRAFKECSMGVQWKRRDHSPVARGAGEVLHRVLTATGSVDRATKAVKAYIHDYVSGRSGVTTTQQAITAKLSDTYKVRLPGDGVRDRTEVKLVDLLGGKHGPITRIMNVPAQVKAALMLEDPRPGMVVSYVRCPVTAGKKGETVAVPTDIVLATGRSVATAHYVGAIVDIVAPILSVARYGGGFQTPGVSRAATSARIKAETKRLRKMFARIMPDRLVQKLPGRVGKAEGATGLLAHMTRVVTCTACDAVMPSAPSRPGSGNWTLEEDVVPLSRCLVVRRAPVLCEACVVKTKPSAAPAVHSRAASALVGAIETFKAQWCDTCMVCAAGDSFQAVSCTTGSCPDYAPRIQAETGLNDVMRASRRAGVVIEYDVKALGAPLKREAAIALERKAPPDAKPVTHTMKVIESDFGALVATLQTLVV